MVKKKKMNEVKKKKEKKKRKGDNLGSVLHFKCRILFKGLCLDLARNGISRLSNYLGFA